MNYIAFIGPSGFEVLIIFIALIVFFGAKDAPRIMRKISSLSLKIRHTANEFKHDVMYSDMRREADEKAKLNNQDYSIVENDNNQQDDIEDKSINLVKDD